MKRSDMLIGCHNRGFFVGDRAVHEIHHTRSFCALQSHRHRGWPAPLAASNEYFGGIEEDGKHPSCQQCGENDV